MKHSQKISIDILASILYMACANPLITGLLMHEWISLGIVLIIVVHIAANADTITLITKQRVHQGKVGLSTLFVDALLLVCLLMAAVSGLMISSHVLPTFGLYAEGYWFWMPIHVVSAKVLLALLIVHIFLHGKSFVLAVTSYRKREKSVENGTE